MKKKTRRILFGIVFAIMAVIIAGLAVTAARMRAYNEFVEEYDGRYFEGTSINGMDVSGKTVEEAEAMLQDTAADFSMEVTFREDQKESIGAADIDFHYVSSGEAAAVLDRQDPRSWYDTWKKSGEVPVTEATAAVETVYDEQKLADLVRSFPELQEENMVAPEDARMEYQDGKYVVIPEITGTTLDADKVLKLVVEAAREGNPSVNITEAEGVYEDPAITLDGKGKNLQKQADELNSLIAGCVTYKLPHGKTQVLDGEVMRNWLTKDENGKLIKDEMEWDAHITEYVQQMADAVYSVGEARTFHTTGAGDIVIAGGNYGYEVAVAEEIEKLKEELAAGEVVTREPVYYSWETSMENNGFGYSYVEIDCSRQYLWIYVDGQVVLETPVVTGQMTVKRATPAGTCLLYGKELDATLIGQGNEYRTKVAYWMPFNGGVGMHDAWWRSAFGGDIYLYDGSHGCINMPVDMAAAAFDIVTLDMPIVVYYSENYTLY